MRSEPKDETAKGVAPAHGDQVNAKRKPARKPSRKIVDRTDEDEGRSFVLTGVRNTGK